MASTCSGIGGCSDYPAWPRVLERIRPSRGSVDHASELCFHRGWLPHLLPFRKVVLESKPSDFEKVAVPTGMIYGAGFWVAEVNF